MKLINNFVIFITIELTMTMTHDKSHYKIDA